MTSLHGRETSINENASRGVVNNLKSLETRQPTYNINRDCIDRDIYHIKASLTDHS